MDNNKKLLEGLLKADGIDPAGATEFERIALGKMLDEQSKTKQPKLGIAWPDTWRLIMQSKITKFAIAAMIVVAVLIGINRFGGSIDGSGVVWASVAERFGSVPFFKATIYIKKDALDRPEQIEIWRNKQGLARLRYGSQVVFAGGGKVIQAFDLESKSQTKPHGMLVSTLAMFGADEFSLETVVQGIPNGQLVNVTPLVNAEASISEDIVVFDIEGEGSPQWCRIWALRESKLPTHIRIWDPRNGECVDVILTYSREQQNIFFDPQAFSSEMKKSGNRKINLAYMFLEDPGGKQIFPGTVDEHRAFEVTTQTIDGREWSLGDYRGKTVLVYFWNENSYRQVSWLKEIHRRFGDRNDFVMVGVSLRKDAESSESICKKQGIDWTQLHEPGMGHKNSLARAFGVDDTYCGWMVWKDGTIEELHGHLEAATGQIEASVIGFTYASGMWLLKKLQERQKLHGPLRAEEIIELCGDSYTVEDSPIGPGRKRWVYEAYNKDKSRIRKFHVEIENETVVSYWISSLLVDPATVTISFSSEFIRDHIESQVQPDVFEKMYKDYQVTVSAKKGDLSYCPFAHGSIKSDESYVRQLAPGIYDIVIIIGPEDEHGTITKIIKKIVLRKNVQLNKNESKTIRFE